jgi:antitoxin component of RelBE/YafQ-DinJ toxin-antitoxin module
MTTQKPVFRFKPLRPDTINARIERRCRLALESFARKEGLSLSDAVNRLLTKALEGSREDI